MQYKEEACSIKGTWNKTSPFTATRHVRMYGESLSDVAKWLRDTPRKWGLKSSEDNSSRGMSWDLNAGWAGALKLAEEGWSEGARDLEQRLHAIIPAAGREARWGYSVQGYRPSVGRFLSGNPNNMVTRSKRQAGQAPILHIVVNSNASCMITADQMRNYGTALVGLIDRLETAGRRIQLDVMYALRENGSGPDTRVVCGWNVKQAADHIDLAAVAFAIAHPAAFRRIGFAMIERGPADTQNGGYGYCADILPCDMMDPAPGAMLLDGVNHEPTRCNSPQDALRLACEQLNKAAVLAGHATIDNPLIEYDEIFA